MQFLILPLNRIGKTRAGWTTKFHLMISESGIELSHLSPANHSDSKYFYHLHDKINNLFIRYIIADKGSDSDAIRSCIDFCGQTPVIPYRRNRKEIKPIDYNRYKTRDFIERMFVKIKEHRRIATRYDKLDITFFPSLPVLLLCRQFVNSAQALQKSS